MTPDHTTLSPASTKAGMITAQADARGEDQDDYRYLVTPVRHPNRVSAPFPPLAQEGVPRLRKGGVEVTGYDRNWEVTDVASIDRLVVQVPAPRIIWVMVPAGALTDAVITEHSEKLERGDMVIDGGNSRFTERALPVFDALRPGGERADSFIHVGGVGGPLRQNGAQRHRIWSDAGLPEGYHLLAAKDIITDLLGTFRAWQKGTVVRSWLLDLPVKALEEEDPGCKKSTTRRGFGALPPVRRPRNPDRRSRGSKLTGLGCVPAWSEASKPACSNRKST